MAGRHGLQKISRMSLSSTPTARLPDFLLPAFSLPSRSRPLSTTPARRSRVGAAPFSVPQNVQITISGSHEASQQAHSRPGDDRRMDIEGPLGKLSLSIPSYMTFIHDAAAGKAQVTVLDRSERRQREMWGTVRSYINSHVLGVSEGHVAILRLVGVGYRVSVEDTSPTAKPEYPGQKFVSLKIGFPQAIDLGVPMGVKASAPQPTRILLEGTEKEVVTEFAAKIRKLRKPEPYKGKGIFVNDETIKLKSKKIK